MRVLTRMRPLVAIAALLLLTLAPIAQANVPGRPIDRPEGPPDVVPTQIGEPDTGNNLTRGDWRMFLGEVLRMYLPASGAPFRTSTNSARSPNSRVSRPERRWR